MATTTKTTAAREFFESDWYGFAGAEGWVPKAPYLAADTKPLIREFSDDVVGVADAQGVQIIVANPTTEEYTTYNWNVEFPSQSLALCILDGIKQNVTGANLLAAGFTED